MRKLIVLLALLFAGTCIAAGTLYAFAGGYGNNNAQQAQQATQDNIGGAFSFHHAINKVARSIVNVYTQNTVNGEVINTFGSGIIMTSDGYVLTNFHVVGNASEIAVHLLDGQIYKASLVGIHAPVDLAVIKMDITPETKITPIVVPDHPRPVSVGDVVIAIGNPLNLGQSATLGIVSAIGRQTADEKLAGLDLIQTDVALNTGNSGGALINTNGELVGINSIVVNQAYGNQVTGLGFAIPAKTALNVLHQLISTGKVQMAYLGAKFSDAFSNNRSLVVVNSIDPNGPAAKAGVQVGDIILSINSQPVISDRSLLAKLNQAAPGEQVILEIERANQILTLPIVLDIDLTQNS